MKRVIEAGSVLWLLVLGPVAFVALIGPWVERQFLPVSKFEVEYSTCEGGCVTVSGVLNKYRACEFIEAYARVAANNEPAQITAIEYRDKPHGLKLSRPQGLQKWGPWYVEANHGDTVTLFARHQCHPFWVTETRLAQVVVP